MIILLTLCSVNNIAFAITDSPKFRAEFIQVEDTQGSNIDFFINKGDLNQDLSNNDALIKIVFDGSSLLREKTYPQNIKLEVSTIINGKKNLLSLINKTIKSKKSAENIYLPISLPRIEQTTELVFDLYDSHNILNSTFVEELVINSNTSTESNLESMPSFDCQDTDGECLVEYLLRNVTFSANYDTNLKTEIYKNDKGRFFVNIPIKKGQKLGSKVRGLNINGSGPGKSSTSAGNFSGIYPYYVEKNEVASSFWNALRNAIEFKFNGSNKSFHFKQDGSLQLSTTRNDGYINIAPGTSTKAPIVFSQGELLTNPIDGALEYDGTNLYFTNGSTRSIIGERGLIGPAGAPGPIGPAGPPGSGSGIDLSNGGFLNGVVQFASLGLIENSIFNGSFQYKTGAQNGYVLTSDANGNASWQDITNLINGTGSSASGIAGAIQFSDGSNGLNSDSSNFFWDNTNKRLGIATPTPQTPLDVRGTTDQYSFQVPTSGSARYVRAQPNLASFSGYNLGLISLTGTFNNFSTILEGAQIGALNSAAWTPTSSPADMVFRTTPNASTTVIERMRITSSGLTGINNIAPNAQLAININNAAEQGLILKATSGQTANLTEWHDNGGNTLAKVDNQGRIVVGTGLTTGMFNVYQPSPTETAFYVNHASGTRTLRLSNNGFENTSTFTVGKLWEGIAGLEATSGTPGRIVSMFRGHHGQTANLTEWRNSTNNTLVTIDNGGNLGLGFSNPSQKLEINGSLLLKDGTQSPGHILTSDANGLASWQAAPSGGASASGIAGALQFSDGTNGFNSNAANFFWNNTNGSLGIGTSTPNAPLTISKPTTIANQKFFTVTANGYEIASLQEGILSNYGGTLSLKDAAGAGNFVRMRYDAGYPKIDTDRNNLSFQASTTMQRLTTTYIDFRMGAQTPLIMQNVGGPTATFTSTNSGNEVLVIKGAINQNNHLTEWQDRNGNQLLAIGETGRIHGNASGQIDFVNSLNENAGIMIEPIAGDGRIRMRHKTNPSSSIEFWHGGGLIIPEGTLAAGNISNSVKWGYGAAGNSNNLRLDSTSTTAADATLKLRAERYADTTSNGQPNLEIAAKRIKFQISDPSSWLGSYTTIAEITRNGKFAITDGTQTNGYVFTSNINGEGSWQDPASLLGSGASGITGAIQFSDGTNGFNSDETNFFWDDSNNRLGLGTGSPNQRLQVNGNIGIPYNQGSFVITDATGATVLNSFSQNTGITYFTNYEPNGFDFRNSTLSLLKINGSGDVGINNNSPNAQLAINIGLASQQGIILKATAGQTANLQEWQNSAGTIGAKVNSLSQFSNNQSQSQSEAFGELATVSAHRAVAVGYNSSAGAHGVAIGWNANNDSAGVSIGDGAVSGSSCLAVGIGSNATAGSTIAFGPYAVGGIHGVSVGYGATTGTYAVSVGRSSSATHTDSISIGWGATSTAGHQLTFGSPTHEITDIRFPGGEPKFTLDAATTFKIRGAVSQTANLQEWQNSAGTVLSSIDNGGRLGLGITVPQRKLHISEAMRLEPQTSPPASASMGDLYVDDSGALCFYDGTSWSVAAGAGSCS